jgi:hypothetical protein
MGMKFKIVGPLILSALCLSSLSLAQNQSGPEQGTPLSLIQTAINVAVNSQHPSLDGYLAIYVDPEKWESGLKDSDLGPFLQLKEQKAGRSAVFFFSQSKDSAIGVYFDGATPFGVTAVKTNDSGKIEPGDISAAYKAVTKDMLKPAGTEFHFEHGDVAMDDGTPLTAYLVSGPGAKAN